MRLLHAGHLDVVHRLPRPQSAPDHGRNPRSALRPPLPLHRLRRHRQSGGGGGEFIAPPRKRGGGPSKHGEGARARGASKRCASSTAVGPSSEPAARSPSRRFRSRRDDAWPPSCYKSHTANPARRGLRQADRNNHERHSRQARRPPRQCARRRRRNPHRGAAQARQAHRARAHRAPDGPRLVRGARHVRRAPLHRFRHGEKPHRRRRRGHRLRHRERPHRVRLRQGFHRVRRLIVRNPRAEDHKNPGHGDARPRADRRAIRRRRRPHPGRRRRARRLRRGVQAERARLGRHPADLGDHGPLRRRRRLFAGDDRFHLHGARHQLHVRHRPGRGQNRDQRDRHRRRARRRFGARHQSRRSPTAPTTTTSRRCCRCAG